MKRKKTIILLVLLCLIISSCRPCEKKFSSLQKMESEKITEKLDEEDEFICKNADLKEIEFLIGKFNDRDTRNELRENIPRNLIQSINEKIGDEGSDTVLQKIIAALSNTYQDSSETDDIKKIALTQLGDLGELGYSSFDHLLNVVNDGKGKYWQIARDSLVSILIDSDKKLLNEGLLIISKNVRNSSIDDIKKRSLSLLSNVYDENANIDYSTTADLIDSVKSVLNDKNSSKEVILSSFDALEVFGSQSIGAIEELFPMLVNDDEQISSSAYLLIKNLINYEENILFAYDFLIQKLEKPPKDPELIRWSTELIKSFGYEDIEKNTMADIDRGVKILRQYLSNDNEDLVVNAIEILGNFQDYALDERFDIISVLENNKSQRLNIASAMSLGHISPDDNDTIDKLLGVIQINELTGNYSYDIPSREAAILALGKCGINTYEKVVPELLHLLIDDSDTIKNATQVSIERLCRHDEYQISDQTITSVIKLLEDESYLEIAETILISVGDVSIDFLLLELESNPKNEPVSELITEMGLDNIQKILDSYEYSSGEFESTLLGILEALGEPILLEVLYMKCDDSSKADGLLNAIGPDSLDHIEKIIAGEVKREDEDTDPCVQEMAIIFLENQKGKAISYIPTLIGILEDYSLRETAKNAIMTIIQGTESESDQETQIINLINEINSSDSVYEILFELDDLALPSLVNELNNEDYWTVESIKNLLEEKGDQSIEYIRRGLSSEDEAVVLNCLGVLARLAKISYPAIKDVIDLLEKDNYYIDARDATISILSEIEDCLSTQEYYEILIDKLIEIENEDYPSLIDNFDLILANFLSNDIRFRINYELVDMLAEEYDDDILPVLRKHNHDADNITDPEAWWEYFDSVGSIITIDDCNQYFENPIGID